MSGTNSGGGIGIFGCLGVLFVALKLIGVVPVASWSWWTVTAPFWGGFLLTVVLLMIAFLIVVIKQ